MTSSVFDAGTVPPIELRHRLRIAREYAGLDQSQLAERMGVSRGTVSNAERSASATMRTTINLWAIACGVPATWLRTGELPPDHDGQNFGLGIIRRDAPNSASKHSRSASRKPLHKSVTGEPSRMVDCTRGGFDARTA